MKSDVPNRWPVGTLFETVKPGEPFTKKGHNIIWLKAIAYNTSKVKSSFNAVNSYNGDLINIPKDEVVYPINCKLTGDK